MTKKEIYSPITEEGLLKSLGPFRIVVSDKSISGVHRPQGEISKPLIFGETLTYGDRIIIEKKVKS